ncbi:hypothetical protein EV361DRAFT_812059, partial [Lentinula raphanica]
VVCKLIAGSESVFDQYSSADGAGKSKIQNILALSDAEDLHMRLAEAGALAMLS